MRSRSFLTPLAGLAVAATFSAAWNGAARGAHDQVPTSSDPLPQTAALDWPEEDLSGRMMDGAHRFVERQIAETQARSERFWKYDRVVARRLECVARRESRSSARDHRRRRFARASCRRALWRRREPGARGGNRSLSRVSGALAGARRDVGRRAARRAGDRGARSPYRGDARCRSDPEQILGLAPGLPPERQFARLLAESGCELLIPRSDPAGTDLRRPMHSSRRASRPGASGCTGRRFTWAATRSATKSRKCSRPSTDSARDAARRRRSAWSAMPKAA